MTFGLGIDTGGTFTDAAVVELASGRVLSKGKALTTRQDLLMGIRGALALLDRGLFPRVVLAGLSTTLATNSIVEGKGGRVGLILAVPDPATFSPTAPLPADEVAVVAGSHDRLGAVATSLDRKGAEEAVLRMAERVDAFAVTGYFSIYNAEHELALKAMIAAACGKPVVCGHELSGDVGLLERGVTAALNARLLPVIGELLAGVRKALAESGIRAPLMVVRGDGTLLSGETAASVPVETILSGPAASVVGACRLTGLDDAVVVDMGGTTTDIALVRGRSVATSRDGALVGGWKTRVHAADIWTVGLGGDSRIRVRFRDEFEIGPRRVVPISLAALSHPELPELLVGMKERAGRPGGGEEPEFFTLLKRPVFPLSRGEEALVAALDGRLLDRAGVASVAPFVAVERFVELGCVAEVAFTPTDLLHAGGELALWDGNVAAVAADLLARRAGMQRGEFLDRLLVEVAESIRLQVAARGLADGGVEEARTGAGLALLGRLLRLGGDAPLFIAPRLDLPLVAVGAPVAAYFPRVAAGLGARLVIPEHAEVANAVGAVTGRVVGRAEAVIRPERPEGFAVVAPDGRRTFATLAEAEAFAEEFVRRHALEKAQASGGSGIRVTVERREETAPLASGWGDGVLMELRVSATAVGSPFAG